MSTFKRTQDTVAKIFWLSNYFAPGTKRVATFELNSVTVTELNFVEIGTAESIFVEFVVCKFVQNFIHLWCLRGENLKKITR